MTHPSRYIHRQIWLMAWPMILSNVSTPLLGAVDTAVMGHMSAPHFLGAVAIGGLIFNFLYWGFGFLRMGTTGLAAQAWGNADHEALRAILGRALLLALSIAAVMLLLQSPIAYLAFHLIEGSPASDTLARHYYAIRIWSAPAALANYVLIGWFLGTQNPRLPLLMVLSANTVNIVLDLTFVVLLEMDVDGVALASVLAEYASAGLGLMLIRRNFRTKPGRWRWAAVADGEKLRQMVSVNRDIFIRTFCLLASFGFFTAQGARFGDLILATNALLLNFQFFMAYALDGLAHAAEALVGRAVGARDRNLFRDAVRTCAVWSALVAGLFSLAYLAAGPLIVDTLTDLETVRNSAYRFLPWVTVLPLISVWSYLFDGIFVGATRGPEMRDTMVFSTCLVFFPAWYFLLPLGNHGLWLAFTLFMAARSASMALAYWRIQRRRGFIVLPS